MDSKVESKPVIVNLSYEYKSLINKVMNDEKFLFDNFKLYLEVSGYDQALEFERIKNDPEELKKFNKKMLARIESLIKKGCISKTIYGLKPQ